jgi:hypothetical protein
VTEIYPWAMAQMSVLDPVRALDLVHAFFLDAGGRWAAPAAVRAIQ